METDDDGGLGQLLEIPVGVFAPLVPGVGEAPGHGEKRTGALIDVMTTPVMDSRIQGK